MHNPQQIHPHRLRIFDASLVVGFLSAEIGPTIFSCALKPENAVETWSTTGHIGSYALLISMQRNPFWTWKPANSYDALMNFETLYILEDRFKNIVF